ncbi:Agamous-like MADS-box protein AGL62 [Cardamine amara subsp. amara]|uniref:Agamous-like MADS-box protein AGL62 n=1 Tax=Cardamine amara subsp. amara TaxID=228776 RepID=A0ABD1AVL6_CARAN
MVRLQTGRKKIEMKKMTKKSHLQVTFSKRRFGLFKKASELCTLCDAKILMIVFSPGGKVFSFGHQDVKDLIYRFSNGNHNSDIFHQHNNNLQLAEVHQDRNIQSLNKRLTEVMAKEEYERSKKKDLDSLRVFREEIKNWYEKDVKELDMNQTNHLICALQNMKNKLVSEISQYPPQNVSQIYLGESNGTFRSHNVDVGIDHFDQRRNGFNYNLNMLFPNHVPSFGYDNNGVIIPSYNFNSDRIQPS